MKEKNGVGMARAELPRLMIAGLAGDSGKSLISAGLLRAFRNSELNVAPFKKGPDFIDASWLGLAAGVPGRNLDAFMMPDSAINGSLLNAAARSDIAVIEGARGLFDGIDAEGSYSSARLAKSIGAPVILVVDVAKTTRTAAALVKGCQAFDPELELAGVILNRVGTTRQEAVIAESIRSETGLSVLGAIPRLSEQHLPGRHLGLVPAVEHPSAEEAVEKVAGIVKKSVNLSLLLDIAEKAPALKRPVDEPRLGDAPKHKVRIGVLIDKAFSFYYPENLESLEESGAEIVRLSPIDDSEIPEIDALYAGGGFPEVYASALSGNRPFIDALSKKIGAGLPVWAECGGLVYLSRSLEIDGRSYPMSGALPFSVEHTSTPQGHGYVEARVDRPSLFLPNGLALRGHEFHYSRLLGNVDELETVLALDRGVGVGNGRDGVKVGSVVASYTHLHALGAPEWAAGMVRAAEGRSS